MPSKHTYQTIAIDWGVHTETAKRWVKKILYKNKGLKLERPSTSKRTVRIPQAVVDKLQKPNVKARK